MTPPGGSGLTDRLVGAPISWGVCEVPGWGPKLEPELVLSEMATLGLRGTELGPVGYLPGDPAALRNELGRHGLRPIAAFVPVACDSEFGEPPAELMAAARSLVDAGGEVLLLALVADADWGPRRPVASHSAVALARGLEVINETVSELGLTTAIHPHVGSLVETAAEVAALDALTSVPWCLDTGHMLIGGIDPAGFVRSHADRIAHVHLKDVDGSLARRVEAKDMSLAEGTRAGLFLPLGEGDADIAGVLDELERAGYEGWLTLEQDTVLGVAGRAEPRTEVARSVEFVRAYAEAAA